MFKETAVPRSNHGKIKLTDYLLFHGFGFEVRPGGKTPKEIDALLANPRKIKKELEGQPVGLVCRDSDGGKDLSCHLVKEKGRWDWKLKPCSV